ncbi:MAG TPA: GNAT family N-acetyltransferase [Allosphingosinicella sp.]|jgi:RimJ/RimL family protein N-acetyltransferase
MLATPAAPTLETPRLRLRGWRSGDFEPHAAMLADDATARFITARGKALSEAGAWSETLWLIGHWQALDFGMFVVEERATGAFVGRVGPLRPPWWPAFEIAWSLAPAGRGRGYATEAAAAAIQWSFETFAPDRIVSIIDPRNLASRKVAERLGERRTAERFTPFRDPCDVWELRREEWSSRRSRAGLDSCP